MNRRSFLRGAVTSPVSLAAASPIICHTVTSEELKEALGNAKSAGFVTAPTGREALFVTLPNGDVVYKAPSVTVTPTDFGEDGGVVYGDPDEAKARLLDALMTSDSLGWEIDENGHPADVTDPGPEYATSPVGKWIGMGSWSSGGESRRDRENAMLAAVANTIRRYRRRGVFFGVEFAGFLAFETPGHPGVEHVVVQFRVVPVPDFPANIF